MGTTFNRMMLAFKAGLQFGGKRNLYDVFGYPKVLTTELLLAKYQRQDLASRVVNEAPDKMWVKFPTVKEPKDVKTKWEAFVKRHILYQKIIQADKLCAFGPYSILWLGLPGSPDTPAPKTTDLNNIAYVQAYGAEMVRIRDIEKNKKDPRFGMPTKYEVIVGSQEEKQTVVVHFSRIIHIVDQPLQGVLYSEPRLNQIYNVLDDLLKVGGGSAELFWLTSNRGMQVDVDKDMELGADDAKNLSDELDDFQHQLRRYVRTRGVKITSLGGDVADPSGPFSTSMSILSSATHIPQRILTGSEAGQLASEQDRANWAEYIKSRRLNFGQPYVLTPIVKTLGAVGYLPEDAWENVVWEWPEAFDMNPVEQATAIASKGRAIANLSRRNQFGDPIATAEEVRAMVGLPEKVPAGHTLPEQFIDPRLTMTPPAAPGEAKGPQSDGASGATDTPSAITKEPSTNEDGSSFITVDPSVIAINR